MARETESTREVLTPPNNVSVPLHLTLAQHASTRIDTQRVSLDSKRMSSKVTVITNQKQLDELIANSTVVVIDFHTTWSRPCKVISPVFQQLAENLASPNKITFAKCDAEQNQEITNKYGVIAMPTFLVFKSGNIINRVQGANIPLLESAVQQLMAESELVHGSSSGDASASQSSGAFWHEAPIAKGYSDITDQVEQKHLDIMNADSKFGGVRTLLDPKAPSSLSKGKGKGKDTAEAAGGKDWVESDTDEQLMLFMPFQSTVKLHSIHLTSLPPASDDDDDETPSRPRTLKIWANSPQIISFEDGGSLEPTQIIELKPGDWDAKTGTIVLNTRFVRFQNIFSICIFFVDVEKEGCEKVRLDRIRLIGESGENREMGKLEKIGDLSGE
ncbi:Thioredoxin-like protein 1 [Rhizina undulata]